MSKELWMHMNGILTIKSGSNYIPQWVSWVSISDPAHRYECWIFYCPVHPEKSFLRWMMIKKNRYRNDLEKYVYMNEIKENLSRATSCLALWIITYVNLWNSKLSDINSLCLSGEYCNLSSISKPRVGREILRQMRISGS